MSVDFRTIASSDSQAGRPDAASGMLGRFPDMLTVSDVCEVTGLSSQTVRKRCADGTFPGVRIGRRWFVSKDRFVGMFGD